MQHEGLLGLKLTQNLPAELKQQTQTFKLMKDPGMKQIGDLTTTDRWNQDDQRHLCGAFRDNRVVPYEGISVGNLDSEQQQLVLDIAEQFSSIIQADAGDEENTDQRSIPGDLLQLDRRYYFRIRSPVIIFEFDHHSGVFLTNTEPAKFHIHSVVRTSNAGDDGNALNEPSEKLQYLPLNAFAPSEVSNHQNSIATSSASAVRGRESGFNRL